MKFCKPFWTKHNWLRYDVLIEQFGTGGTMAWHECEKCKKVKFDWADSNTPQRSGWIENKKNIDRIMGYTPKDYR